MAATMLEKEINIYSEKYNIHGVIKDYGVVTKLFFSYEGKEIVMGIKRIILKGESYEDIGRDIIDSYVANISNDVKGQKLQLHYWYITEHEADGTIYRIGHGIVTGHKKLSDSIDTHTSAVQAIHIDDTEDELILITKNSVYHCPLEYCRFRKQDAYPDIIPDYKNLKEKYSDAIKYPSIEPGKVLLVIANFCAFYFHSLYYVPKNSEDGESLEYCAMPHIGMFQDSYLINTKDYEVDLAYFPHFQNIEFYSEITDGCPLYIENIGDVAIYAKTRKGTIRIEPGERKEIKEENAEEDPPALPGGDLYPAGVIE